MTLFPSKRFVLEIWEDESESLSIVGAEPVSASAYMPLDGPTGREVLTSAREKARYLLRVNPLYARATQPQQLLSTCREITPSRLRWLLKSRHRRFW